MRGQNIFKKSWLLLAVCSLVFVACASPDQPKEQKKETAQHAPQQQDSPNPPFVACHPPSADMSPDGTKFVTLTPNAPLLNILTIDKEQTQTQMSLPRAAQDVVLLSADLAVLSFGATGEVALADLKKGQVSNPVKIGTTAQGMCRTSTNQVIIADSGSNQIHLFDPKTGQVVKSLSVNGSPTQMRWITEGIELEAADAEGRTLGKVTLTEQSAPTPAAN